MNYTAFLTRDNFDTACAAASQGQADAIARAFPDVPGGREALAKATEPAK